MYTLCSLKCAVFLSVKTTNISSSLNFVLVNQIIYYKWQEISLTLDQLCSSEEIYRLFFIDICVSYTKKGLL